MSGGDGVGEGEGEERKEDCPEVTIRSPSFPPKGTGEREGEKGGRGRGLVNEGLDTHLFGRS